MTMIYSLNAFGSITRALDNGATLLLPPENNGTPEWRTYQAWLSEGNTPLPAPAPPAPGPDYLAFWDALMVSTVYASIREQSFVSLPMNTLATEFIALIGDAKAGRANEVAIQASMAAILTTGTFTAAQLTELQTALVAGHLDDIYALS
jgi:hypothetical protein